VLYSVSFMCAGIIRNYGVCGIW